MLDIIEFINNPLSLWVGRVYVWATLLILCVMVYIWFKGD